MRKVTILIISLALILSLVSSSGGFDSNANRVNPGDPNDKRQREYARDNASNPHGRGGYYGGHDTITAEGMLLKKKVHVGNKPFADFTEQALPFLRQGAHDEDSTRTLGMYIGSEAPLGGNGDGNFYHHFYDPDNGKGLLVP